VDKTSIEVFGNNGAIILSVGAIFNSSDNDRLLEVYSKGGKTKVELLEIYELNFIWRE